MVGCSVEVGTGFEPVYTDLQSVASPLGQPTAGWARDPLRADDEARTRDLNLGKVALYQLSYVRLLPGHPKGRNANRTIADALRTTNSGVGPPAGGNLAPLEAHRIGTGLGSAGCAPG
jgi:hypothetical protein